MGHQPTYDELIAENAELRRRLEELEKLIEQVRRSGQRQAAPFSKGKPKNEPARPGRKKGKAHGRHGHRMAPAEADRVLDAPLPQRCPDCGEEVELERWADQYQTELPELRPTVTRFPGGSGTLPGLSSPGPGAPPRAGL